MKRPVSNVALVPRTVNTVPVTTAARARPRGSGKAGRFLVTLSEPSSACTFDVLDPSHSDAEPTGLMADRAQPVAVSVRRPYPACTGRSHGSASQMESEGSRFCYLLRSDPEACETFTWSGERSGGPESRAETVYSILNNPKRAAETAGGPRNGKGQGEWLLPLAARCASGWRHWESERHRQLRGSAPAISAAHKVNRELRHAEHTSRADECGDALDALFRSSAAIGNSGKGRRLDAARNSVLWLLNAVRATGLTSNAGLGYPQQGSAPGARAGANLPGHEARAVDFFTARRTQLRYSIDAKHFIGMGVGSSGVHMPSFHSLAALGRNTRNQPIS